MAIHITGAPCCWGVDDVRNPYLPPWQKVLYEAVQAGYKSIELGPYGYLPLDIEVVSAELRKNGISIVAGTIFDDLLSEENYPQVLKQVDDICGIITKLPELPREPGQRYKTPYLTVMDWGHDERDYAAGHPDKAPRLSEEDWQRMMEHIKGIAKAADKWGVRAVVHPHAGGYIEFADEIDKLMEDIPAEVAGLCLDTGHLRYSGHQLIEQGRQMVKHGDLGEIRLVMMQFPFGAYNTAVEETNAAARWRMDPKKAGPSFVLGDVGTHPLFLAEAMIPDMKIKNLMCTTKSFIPTRQLEDNAFVIMNLEGGAQATCWASSINCGALHGQKVRISGGHTEGLFDASSSRVRGSIYKLYQDG